MKLAGLMGLRNVMRMSFGIKANKIPNDRTTKGRIWSLVHRLIPQLRGFALADTYRGADTSSSTRLCLGRHRVLLDVRRSHGACAGDDQLATRAFDFTTDSSFAGSLRGAVECNYGQR